MASLQGGCLCGKVRYTVSADPVFAGVCHCKDCQKGSGSAFSMVMAVPEPGLAITGATTTYASLADSGKEKSRRFCPTCGSPITAEASVMPGIVMVEVGTLDDPEAAELGMHIYCRSKLGWVAVPEGAGAFPEMPPMG